MCIEIESDTDDIFEDDTCTAPVCSSPCVEHSLERRPSHSHNPWILHCHRGHIAKMLGIDIDSNSQNISSCNFENPPSCEFLLLENLTWRYIHLLNFLLGWFSKVRLLIVGGSALVCWI